MIKKIIKQKNLNLIYRKLKLSDFKEFSKLFELCFKKKISYNFYKWRYFSDKFSFCYGVFLSSQLIANVGMKLVIINDTKRKYIYSRHSSMVLKKYRNLRIYSFLLDKVRKLFLKDTNFILMWPNKNNHATFGIKKKNIVKKKFYLYASSLISKNSLSTSDININNLYNLKSCIKKKSDFFYKDFNYFKKRYLDYKRNDYFLNKFEENKFSSFFILKKNKFKNSNYNIILDHFGSVSLREKHKHLLLSEKINTIYLSERKINYKYYKFVSFMNLHIAFFKKNFTKKNNLKLLKKKFMLGDTDTFISLN